MTKKPESNAPAPFKPVRGLSLPPSQSNGAQVHQVHKPDWTMWSGDQRVEIEQAVALTMDIDPTFLPTIQPFITPESFPEDRRADFSKRQAALKREFKGKTSSMLSDAVHFATRKEWSGLPPELVTMATVPPDATPRGVKALAIGPDEPAPTLGTLSEPVKKQEPPPLTTPEIADAFDGINETTATQWRKWLGDVNNHEWLLPARAVKASAPKSATWCPLVFAGLLLERKASVDSLNRAFVTNPRLKPWLKIWQEQKRERNAFGQ